MNRRQISINNYLTQLKTPYPSIHFKVVKLLKPIAKLAVLNIGNWGLYQSQNHYLI